MITLAPSDTLYAVAGTASAVTYTIFGMQMNAGTPSWSKLAQGQVSNSVGLIYTSPSGTTSLIAAIVLLNTTSATVNVQVFAGGSTASKQLYGVNVPAYGQMFIDQSGIQVNDASGSLLLATPTVMSPNLPVSVAATGSPGSEVAAARRDHVHGGVGGIGALFGGATGGNAALIGAIPANSLQAGSTIRVQFTAQISTSSSGNETIWWMMGPSGICGNTDLPQNTGQTYTPNNDVWLSNMMGFTCSSSFTALTGNCLITMRASTGNLLVPYVIYSMVDNYGGNSTLSNYRAGTTGYLGSGKIDPTVTNYVRLAASPWNGIIFQLGTGYAFCGAIELVM